MLDNLRLDLTDQTVINTFSTNTNATDTHLNYLKNGGGTTTDQYPTAGLSGSEWGGTSYSTPEVYSSLKDNITSGPFGLGSGKIGVIYNYCVTSAGTYCWGDGTSYDGSPTTDPEPSSDRDIEGDICPKGWRLPSSQFNDSDYMGLYSAYSGASLGQGIAMRNVLSASFSKIITDLFISIERYNIKDAGYFWSSTWNDSPLLPYSSSNFRTLVVDSSDVYFNGDFFLNLDSGLDASFGAPIRCVMDS